MQNHCKVLYNQVFNVMWEPSLISPWQQTGKHLKREKERKEEYLVFPFDSQLFFIKGQLDLFSSITACCRLEWLLLLFSSVLQQNPSTSKLTLLSPYRKVFIFSSLSGASCQATSEDSTNSCFCRQSRFFFSSSLASAGSCAKLPPQPPSCRKNFSFFLCGHVNRIHPTTALTASVAKCLICPLKVATVASVLGHQN